MSPAWTTIVALSLATMVIKASGPLALGNSDLPPWARSVIALVAPALLAAFVVVETFGRQKDLVLDARAAGLAAAAAVLAARLSVLWAIAAAAAGAALLRALG